jgi:hypothetical protein
MFITCRLAIPANTRLSCKDLQGTSTLAYYKNSKLTAVKFFMTFGPGVILTIQLGVDPIEGLPLFCLQGIDYARDICPNRSS